MISKAFVINMPSSYERLDAISGQLKELNFSFETIPGVDLRLEPHLKDFYSKDVDFQNHDQQSTVGEGFIEWPVILSEIKKTKCEIIAIEHDDPKDYKDYITKSLNYLISI